MYNTYIYVLHVQNHKLMILKLIESQF